MAHLKSRELYCMLSFCVTIALLNREHPQLDSLIIEHIQNIYKEGELKEEETLRKIGNPDNSFSKPTNYYNLDMVISVG